MPELRRDPIFGRWVIIASERRGRPTDMKAETLPADDKSKCPFCAGRESQTPPEVMAYHPPGREADKPGWWLRVIPNKYPALDPAGKLKRRGVGMYDSMDGVGAHEVIIESPEHVRHIADMDDKRAEDIFWAYRDRMAAAKKDARLQYALIFKNYGRAAGATLSHPHSQLIALPMVPIRVKQEMDGAQSYYGYKERCVFCDVIHEEQRFAERIVGEDEHFIAIEPYASRSQFETWVLPKNHAGHFEKITEAEVKSLARLMKSVMGKLKRVLGDPPFNWMLHTTPLHEPETPSYHWHIEIMPKMAQVAGFEWGSGCYINPTPPELAAKLLNEA
ncbi:MAG: galactose-1-phosphate uridylyltransferase [Elusimicrobiales bacterium]|nr:galactose-1-phosphate uridylyltransferase [Elusimicrobiales bacterium]